jgi:hypothetical protein
VLPELLLSPLPTALSALLLLLLLASRLQADVAVCCQGPAVL